MRTLLEQPNLTDTEAAEYLSALLAFIGQVQDEYFREELEPDDF